MTDKELRDAAWAELQRTKTGYANLKVKPPTDRNSSWFKAKAFMDQIGGTTPPPPPPPPIGTRHGLGYFKLGPSTLGLHPDKYDLTIVGGSGAQQAASALTGRVITYLTGLSVTKRTVGYDYGVGYDEAASLGAILKDSQGQEILSATASPAGSSVLGDVGLPAYQQAWCRNTEAKIRAYGCEGFYNDDCLMQWSRIGGGKTIAKYPTQPAQQAAMLSFARAVGAYFKPKGIYVAHNAIGLIDGDPRQDSGELTKVWWTDLAPVSDGLMCEGHFVRNGQVRRMGPEWFNNWDGWRSLHPFCSSRNVDLISLDQDANGIFQTYCLATHLLDHDGRHGVACWQNEDDWADPWSTAYDIVAAYGPAVGPATKSGDVWSRDFGGGHRVTVNPVVGTASIS